MEWALIWPVQQFRFCRGSFVLHWLEETTLCHCTSCDVTVGLSLLKVVHTFKHQPPFVSILSRLVPNLPNPEIKRKRQSVPTLLPDFRAEQRRAVACFLPGNSMVLSSVRAISAVEVTSDKHVELPSITDDTAFSFCWCIHQTFTYLLLEMQRCLRYENCLKLRSGLSSAIFTNMD